MRFNLKNSQSEKNEKTYFIVLLQHSIDPTERRTIRIARRVVPTRSQQQRRYRLEFSPKFHRNFLPYKHYVATQLSVLIS